MPIVAQMDIGSLPGSASRAMAPTRSPEMAAETMSASMSVTLPPGTRRRSAQSNPVDLLARAPAWWSGACPGVVAVRSVPPWWR